MHMDVVLTAFRNFCDHPLATPLLVAALLKAAFSLVAYVRCPIARAGDLPDAETARAMVDARFLHSPRFLLTMLVGLTLAVGGLYALGTPEYGALALGAIVVGMYIMVVEPSQLSIDENMLRVAASRAMDREHQALALDRLRAAHRERIALEVALVVGLALMMWLY